MCREGNQEKTECVYFLLCRRVKIRSQTVQSLVAAPLSYFTLHSLVKQQIKVKALPLKISFMQNYTRQLIPNHMFF